VKLSTGGRAHGPISDILSGKPAMARDPQWSLYPICYPSVAPATVFELKWIYGRLMLGIITMMHKSMTTEVSFYAMVMHTACS
jgi:hypothetical protein